MTVEELIEELSKYNAHATITLGEHTVTAIDGTTFGSTVEIETDAPEIREKDIAAEAYRLGVRDMRKWQEQAMDETLSDFKDNLTHHADYLGDDDGIEYRTEDAL